MTRKHYPFAYFGNMHVQTKQLKFPIVRRWFKPLKPCVLEEPRKRLRKEKKSMTDSMLNVTYMYAFQ